MNKFLKFGLLVLLVAGISLALIYQQQINVDSLQLWVNSTSAFAPVIFMLIYIIATLLFLPGAVLTLAGGALFGPIMGTFYNLTAATIGATLAFISARYLAQDWVEKKTGKRIAQLQQGVQAEGWKFVVFVRLVPLFPFNLLNYALGLSKIKLSHYVIASYFAMLPGAIAYTYLGYVGREAMAGDQQLMQKILLAIAFLTVLAFLPSFLKRFSKVAMIDVAMLQQKLASENNMLLLDVRSAQEYACEPGHIEGAVLIPISELEQRLPEFLAYRHQPVVIICRTHKRSMRAALQLLKLGFSDVSVVKKGMTAWQKAGYAVKTKAQIL